MKRIFGFSKHGQVWVETVGKGHGDAIIIEEGEVKE